MGAFDMYYAVKLSGENREKAENLTKKADKLQKRARDLERRYSKRLEKVFDEQVAPFAVTFGKIKNCELKDLDLADRVPGVRALDVETFKVSFGAVQGLASVAGGAAAGAGAAAVTFATVAALATASTGTAIGTLSGAAATSATLAWLGGGSLAAGGMGVAGGMAVLAGVVAIPVVLAAGGFLWWKGTKELTKQEHVATELKAAAASLAKDEAVLDAVADRVNAADKVLKRLRKAIDPLNAWLSDLVQVKDDYRDFTEDERQRLALLASLVVAATAVMASPLVVTQEKRGKSATVPNKEFGATVDGVAALLDEVERDVA